MSLDPPLTVVVVVVEKVGKVDVFGKIYSKGRDSLALFMTS